MRLIDVDKLTYQSNTQHLQPYINKKDIDNAPTINAVVIKEGMTNGDVIKAMFPNVRIIEMPEVGVVQVHDGLLGESRNFSWDWWNSPYKAESEG